REPMAGPAARVRPGGHREPAAGARGAAAARPGRRCDPPLAQRGSGQGSGQGSGLCMRVLIALGGNAMTSADGSARPEDQRTAIALAMEEVAGIVASGAQVVLTHGNGPQVGNLLVKNELAAHVVPPVPLDWCGAQTQATIGFL